MKKETIKEIKRLIDLNEINNPASEKIEEVADRFPEEYKDDQGYVAFQAEIAKIVKIKALEGVGFKCGNIDDNEALANWLGDEIGEADTVMYDFNDLVVSYTIGKGGQGISNSNICGEDRWEDCDDEFINYLYNL